MIQPSQLSQQVRRHLLDDIFAGRLTSGSLLRETELAEQLQVSRTPVREALRWLASDGFVEITPNRSAVVRSLDAPTLRHVYQVRETLEALAAELACGQLEPVDFARLDELRQAVDRASEADYAACCHRYDVQLHRLIAARSGNPVLAREIERFFDLVQLVRVQVGNRDQALALAFAQHNQIVELLRRGDRLAARQAMIDHIRSTRDIALRCAAEDASAG